MRLFLCLFVFVLLMVSYSSKIEAESSYVLPYPSFMPGNKLYSVKVVWDNLRGFWYFGSFSQFQYNLQQSDQYLVEAKTLFEYKQYVLAVNSLKKSNVFFQNTKEALQHAKEENKDVSDKMKIIKKAAEKHVEVIEDIDRFTPDVFNWVPEKSFPTQIQIKEFLQESLQLRQIMT